MGNRWGNGTKEDSEVYSPQQVEAVLDDIGIEVVGETHNDFLCYCPYHGNNDTPAFTVGRFSGVFYCFNASCGESGTLVKLVKNVSSRNDYEAMRLISKNKGRELTYEERAAAIINANKEQPVIPQEALDKLHEAFWGSPGHIYMTERGFTDETLRRFGVGWSNTKQMVFVPVHDANGKPVGGVGRSIKDKRFRNHPGMNPSQLMFNLHRAKRAGSDTLIIAEASFDVMKIDQAGFPYVAGTLGGYWNDVRLQQVSRYFNHFIILTDEDDPREHIYKGCRRCYRAGKNGCQGHNPGLELGNIIANSMQGKRVSWGVYGYSQRYPENIKDPDKLSPEHIKQMVTGAVTNYEFQSWHRA